MADGAWITGSARASGGSRHYKLWVPSTVQKDHASPLLVLLHGCTHDADAMAEISGMNQIAQANRFLVLYPEQSMLANLLKCWNWFDPKHQSRHSGEPAIIAAMAEQVCSAHNIDRDRIFVVGISAGGAMAVIMGATYPDLFSAIAVCAGAEFKAAAGVAAGLAVMKDGGPDPATLGEAAFQAMKPGLALMPRKRMPVIVFHGSADTRVHPVNADQIVMQWSTVNARLAAQVGESAFAISETVEDGQVPGGHSYRKHAYADNSGKLVMEKWIVNGLSHAWSGSPHPHKYGDPKGPNAGAEIWRFFGSTVQTSPAASVPNHAREVAEPKS